MQASFETHGETHDEYRLTLLLRSTGIGVSATAMLDYPMAGPQHQEHDGQDDDQRFRYIKHTNPPNTTFLFTVLFVRSQRKRVPVGAK